MNAKKAKHIRKLVPSWNEAEYETTTKPPKTTVSSKTGERMRVYPAQMKLVRTCGKSVYRKSKKRINSL